MRALCEITVGTQCHSSMLYRNQQPQTLAGKVVITSKSKLTDITRKELTYEQTRNSRRLYAQTNHDVAFDPGMTSQMYS